MSWYLLALGVVCLGFAMWLVVEMVRNVQPGGWLVDGLGVVAVGVLGVTVWGVVRLFGERGEVPVGEYLGYLFLVPFFIPAGIVWSQGEKSRSGTAVLLVAVLTVPFLLLRLHDIWVNGTAA